jgi:hypothetical protein
MKLNLAVISGLASVSLCGLVSAQQSGGSRCTDPEQAKKDTVAALKEVKGNVLVSDKAGITSGANGARIVNSARVTTTGNASAIIAFDCGCDVQLSENQRIDVALPSACPAIVAAVQPVPVAAALGAAPAAPVAATSSLAITPTGLAVTGAVAAGTYAIIRRNRNVSPN